MVVVSNWTTHVKPNLLLENQESLCFW